MKTLKIDLWQHIKEATIAEQEKGLNAVIVSNFHF